MLADHWVKRYISLAKETASWSKDPSRKVGAVAVSTKGQVLATGYNGFPRGIFDDHPRYQDRETKYIARRCIVICMGPSSLF